MIEQQTANEIAGLVRQQGEEPRVAVEVSGMSTWPTGECYYHGVVVVATDTQFRIYDVETKGTFKKKVVIKPGSTFQFNEISSPQESTDGTKMIKFIHDPQEVTFMNVHDDQNWEQFVQFWGSRLYPSSDDQGSVERPGEMEEMAFTALVEQARALTVQAGAEALMALPVAAVIADHSGDNKVMLGVDDEVCILTLTGDRIMLFGVEDPGVLSNQLKLRSEAAFDFDRMTPKGIRDGTDSEPATLGFFYGDRRVTIHNARRVPEFDTMAAFCFLQSGGAIDETPPVTANAAPGWYPDPEGISTHRYWDGTAWTEHRA